MKTASGLFEDAARFATGMAGTAMEMRREMERFCQQQVEKLTQRMDLVTREEFEVVRAMAVAAREENAILKARLDAGDAFGAKASERSATDGSRPGSGENGLDDFIP